MDSKKNTKKTQKDSGKMDIGKMNSASSEKRCALIPINNEAIPSQRWTSKGTRLPERESQDWTWGGGGTGC